MPRLNPTTLTAEQRDEYRRAILPGTPTEILRGDDNAYVIFFYAGGKAGVPCAMAFKGKALKPALHYRYRSDDTRRARCQAWIDAIDADSRRKAEARAARNTPHTLTVGDVLRSTWGYEQTNIDYYEVVALKGKTMVTLRAIGAQCEPTEWMQGNSVPVPGQYIGAPRSYKVNGHSNTVRIESFAIASPMTPIAHVAGRPIFESAHWTAYA